ncbi:MAG TPA: ATP-binding protein [Thermoanaerobaculia bacterium]|nr:ATP-binding protein [Thermoanaerobaculia bacterium]
MPSEERPIDSPPVASRTWKTILPVTFIILSLLAIVALPLVGLRKANAMRRELDRISEPARENANRIELALAIELDNIIGFQVTEQDQYRRAFQANVVRQTAAITRLRALSGELGGEVKSSLSLVEQSSRNWHNDLVQERLLAAHLPAGVFTTLLFQHHPDYERALTAASKLAGSIDAAIHDRREEILRTERFNRNLTTFLSLLALTSAILVIRLGRQMRLLAIDATTRRAEAEREAREARQAVQARDRVLAIVSHDLRNPLNAITLSSSMLAEGGSTDEDLNEQLEVIRLSAGRMNRLIEDLLDAARMEGGKPLPIDPSDVEVESILSEAIELFKTQTNAQQLALKTEMTPDVKKVIADRHRILQVLSNLVGNAIKFTPAGGTIIMAADTSNGMVRFGVRDSGPGIPKEHQDKIFDAYWQAKRADRMGAGLGLPIARGIVESHGGKIWVESEPGEGTTFFFTLPAVVGG